MFVGPYLEILEWSPYVDCWKPVLSFFIITASKDALTARASATLSPLSNGTVNGITVLATCAWGITLFVSQSHKIFEFFVSVLLEVGDLFFLHYPFGGLDVQGVHNPSSFPSLHHCLLFWSELSSKQATMER